MEQAQEAPPLQEVSQPADHSLQEQIKEWLSAHGPDGPDETFEQVIPRLAESVMTLLIETGHVIPGAPPARQILHDAQQFAGQLILSKLAARILNMLAFSNIKTPETKPARKWIDDYLEGKNHGPIGRPMLWPGGLPGMAQLLRDWGFVPTIAQPGQQSYVARAIQPPTVQ